MKRYFLLFIAFFIVVSLLVLKFYKPNTTVTPTPSPYLGPTIKVGSKVVKVMLAKTQDQITKGLSGTPRLDEDEGMLFVFAQKNFRPTFWMKDMLIDLDMIWINDSQIVDIHKNVPKPLVGTPDSDLPLYSPKENIDYILEVNAGFSDANGIKIGDSIDFGNVLN